MSGAEDVVEPVTIDGETPEVEVSTVQEGKPKKVIVHSPQLDDKIDKLISRIDQSELDNKELNEKLQLIYQMADVGNKPS